MNAMIKAIEEGLEERKMDKEADREREAAAEEESGERGDGEKEFVMSEEGDDSGEGKSKAPAKKAPIQTCVSLSILEGLNTIAQKSVISALAFNPSPTI